MTEGLIAGNFVDGVGTYEWSSITTIPAALFALVQTCMIARWVQTVEELMFDMHHISSRCGNLSVISSGTFLGVSVLMTFFSIPDTRFGWTGLSKDDWIELLSFMQGLLYTFNGICFLVLGLQLASFWSAALDSAKNAWRRILSIAVVFCFLCVMRGIIMCMFAFALKKDNLHAVMDSNWGAPTVLLTEWFCLTISFFVLAPTLAGARNDPMPNALPNATLGYNTLQQEETYQGSSSSISMRSNRESNLRNHYLYRQPRNAPGNSGRGIGMPRGAQSPATSQDDPLLNKYSRNSI
ncbi:transmembrane protein, putative [Bodo saltans]|uniref:Transmembrane protein, putative n=1 Tax=Bodo saltans TaxID=75058 RepID=A0A0S4JHY3_BODSA|nr:transmembrane protein, putative [Bodo saltans]|eukprot:CUG89749.1 transmembrane protein, putative [Bodo saltans]